MSAETFHTHPDSPAGAPHTDAKVPGRGAGGEPTVIRPWNIYQKIAFRIGFIYVILLSFPSGIFSLPPNFSWFTNWFRYDWTNLHYRDLYDIARFGPSFPLVTQGLSLPRLGGHSVYLAILIIAVAGALIWSVIDRKPRSYNLLYYWSLVLVRYRAGIGIIGFGMTKLLPVQMPYPSEGLLNTNFGDFTAQKIYWLSVGIVPWYQVFAGIVEITAGSLLFFRKTTVFGAALLFGALGSITIVNHVYDGGVQTYAFYFVLLGLYAWGYYVPRVYKLLILQKPIVPVDYWPSFSKTWQKVVRYGIKTAVIVLFLGVLFYLQLNNFLYDPYKQPSSPGVHELRGYYNVSEFRINNREIPYSPLDTVRWQEATFEKWSTLTYKVNKPTTLDLSNGGGNPIRDIDRSFEITGTGGGRRAFHYYADTIDHTLYLEDKVRTGFSFGGGDDDGDAGGQRGGRPGRSAGERTGRQQEGRRGQRGAYMDGTRWAAFAGRGRGGRHHRDSLPDPLGPDWISAQAWQHIGDENLFIDPRGLTARRARDFEGAQRPSNRNKMLLNYETTDGKHVILRGLNENRDTLYVVLDRADRHYLLSRSTLDAGKYDR